MEGGKDRHLPLVLGMNETVNRSCIICGQPGTDAGDTGPRKTPAGFWA